MGDASRLGGLAIVAAGRRRALRAEPTGSARRSFFTACGRTADRATA